jgi:alpha-galactosidase
MAELNPISRHLGKNEVTDDLYLYGRNDERSSIGQWLV